MRYSFTFDGVKAESIGLRYIPSKEHIYPYIDSNFQMSDESFEGHDGSYYYGTTTKDKTFTMICQFEKKDIRNGFMSTIANLFHPGKSGKLIFSDRPWIWYYATVTDNPEVQLSTLSYGTLTIKMKAYIPFGRTDYRYLPNEFQASLYYDMMKNSGFVEQAKITPTTWTPTSTIVTATKSDIIMNPGTVRTPLTIKVSGNTGTGINIVNNTNNTHIKLTGFNITSAQYVTVDSASGKVMITTTATGNSELSFIYHDSGFIDLEPCEIIRNIPITYESGSGTVYGIGFDQSIVGKYMYAQNGWRKITSVTSDSVLTVNHTFISQTVDDETVTEFQETSCIAKMNELTITAASSMTLNKLDFEFIPRFS